jgi:glycerol dehydrogenase
MLSVFGSPNRYIQGAHASELLGYEMKKIGLSGPVFILAGRQAHSLLAGTWKETFQSAEMEHTIFDFSGECSHEEINRAALAAAEFKARVVVGAGGGKVLDCARAVADKNHLPVVNCPTVASSDAPCSALSVIYTPEGEFQEYKFYKQNPFLVVVDTAIIAKSPARFLVSGMGDALATWFEAGSVMAAGRANQLGGRTTIAASALAELCYKTLLTDGVAALEALKAQTVTPELERLVEANTLLSGLGFESGGLAIAHSVHNGLTRASETHKYLHGEKVAFGLIVQLVAECKPSSLLEEVIAFCLQVGLPVCLSDIGLSEISDEQLAAVAERTVAEGETAHNEPFQVTAALIADAIKKADKRGCRAKEEASRAPASSRH